MHVEIIERPEDLPLGPQQWNRLVERSAAPVVFLTHQWVHCWWNHFGNGRDFCCLVVRDGSEVVGLAPFAITRRSVGKLPVRVLEIIGTQPLPQAPMGLSDRVDFVYPAKGGESILALMLESLSRERERFDLIHFPLMTDGSPTAKILETSAIRKSWIQHKRVSARSPYVILEGDWESFLSSRRRRFRKNVRRKMKQVTSKGYKFERHQNLRSKADFMGEVFELAASGWKDGLGQPLFRTDDMRQFFQDVTGAFAEQGWLDLSVLRSPEKELMAYELNFAFAGCLHSYTCAYDREAASLSPGFTLSAFVVMDLFDSDLTEYDLGRGEERYKWAWTDHARNEIQCVLGRRALVPRLAARVGFKTRWQLGRLAAKLGLRR